MQQITLAKSADPQRRIDAIQLLVRKAEDKVIHADTFRQRNMNYALVVFAGLIGLRSNVHDATNQVVISTTLLVLSIVFCVWDRRWHRVKHGWDSTGKACYNCIVQLTNDPNQDVSFPAYDSKAEQGAEWRSWQPVVFYLLVAASVGSFFIH
jgi:hypothetical protein